MMNQEIKAQWVTALRSGDYKQGTSVLHRVTNGEDTYCCLGVLCDLAEKAGVSVSRHNRSSCSCSMCNGDRVVTYGGMDDFLPGIVKDWAGLDSPNPTTSVQVEDTNTNASLSYLNDNGKTFEEIAAIIEREF
jgi:hypothetical protein